jgi:hypothetical protein
MNDLKTKFQERMGHEYLGDLVWWHKIKRLLSYAEWEAELGRTLVRWSQAGHRRHQVHTQLSPDTIQLVSARDDGPDDDGETVPASGRHSGPRGGMLVVLSQHTHPAVLGSWLDLAESGIGVL